MEHAVLTIPTKISKAGQVDFATDASGTLKVILPSADQNKLGEVQLIVLPLEGKLT